MKILKKNPFPIQLIQASDKDGKVSAVVILKATYNIPAINDRIPRIAKEQVPILPTDVCEGEPGLSTPYFESDHVPRKAKCDVIVKATAHSPNGHPLRRMEAGFRVDSCIKKARIIGDRMWKKRWFLTWLRGPKATSPKPFTSMPITYARAFGGHWEPNGKKGALECHEANPLGVGFAKHRKNRKLLPGTPLPNIEDPKQSVTKSKRKYRPCSFGPIGRSWPPRVAYAGTYDESWIANVFPLLPQNFDERFFQCAPLDQQIDYPKGGEIVELWNLHPNRPHIRFPLPKYKLPLMMVMDNRSVQDREMVIDGVLIDADAMKLTLVWRAQFPLKRSLREVLALGFGKLESACRMSLILGDDEGCGCGGSKKEQAAG
jgi:hypothetical protein